MFSNGSFENIQKFFEMENLIYSVGKNRKYNKPQKAYVHTNMEI